MKMITVENLSFLYRKSKRAVLHDFSLSLEKGRVYGLLGKNGAGKSTLLYLMSGLLTPKSGKVVYHDVDVRRRLPITLQDMFLVPEEFDLPPVSLISYIELNSPFYPRFSKEDMVKYLHYFEMDINIDLGALSMGQKKKVFMSFALATNTSLLLMDEPTNGLDIPGKSQFRKFIASGMTDDKTILICYSRLCFPLPLFKVIFCFCLMNRAKIQRLTWNYYLMLPWQFPKGFLHCSTLNKQNYDTRYFFQSNAFCESLP